MKFLLIVLIIRFLFGLVSNKKDTVHANKAGETNEDFRHPAEFDLR